MAEELTADTFARAFDARWRFDPGRGTAKAWLYGIATNVVRLHRRVEGRKQRAYARVAACVGVDEGPEARVADGSTVREVLGRLPSREIDVVLLVAGAGLTYEEAAHALGVPVGTVRSRYSRARRRVSALAPGRK